VPSEQDILLEGPWTHRYVSANGIRFHVVEAGSGPLVLLLHGFPEFWWAWRNQIPALAAAGYHVVAADLRGYGGTDKPPGGYDLYTLAGDVGRLVRALGEQEAAVVGHDWGGVLAWAAATLHPGQVRQLAVLEMPHPARIRTSLFRDPELRRRLAYAYRFQVPGAGERMVLRDSAAWVAGALREWSGGLWPETADFAEAETRYRDAIRIPGTVPACLEYYRWAFRSLTRPTGARMLRLLAQGVRQPTLQVHGRSDSGPLPLRTALGSERYVHAPYTMRIVDGSGHFLPEEAPGQVTGFLLDFLEGPRT
jgi:pimeloyl-ACP methyl ester carboxylesterase